jgi:RNA polymerase sigma-70 factor (ECF subfamily)
MSEPINTDPDAKDKSDMARLVNGHDAALNDLMDRHAAALFNYLLRQLANEEDAEDLAQETFARVYQSRASYKPANRFSTWLYTIATNLVRDRFRWRKRHPAVSLDAAEENAPGLAEKFSDSPHAPSDTIVAKERAAEIRQAVQALPEELRTALILFQYEDQSHAQIASILSCSPKAVEMRLYHARNQLKKSLSHICSEL